ncbi:MAG: hypothetical protein ACRCS3_00765 [Paracoccaceae bacterium]
MPQGAKPLTVSALEAELHFGQGENRATPVRFRLALSNGQNVTLSISSAGDQIVLDQRPLIAADMAEYGTVVLQDVVNLVAPRLVDAAVQSITLLQNKDRQIGISINTYHDAFHLWVDGDEWHWGNDLDLQKHHWLNGKPAVASGEATFPPLAELRA